MENIRKVLITLMAISLLGACARNEADITNPDLASRREIKVHFNARHPETKTIFGEAETNELGQTIYPTLWSGNDSRVMVSLNYESGVVAGVNREDDEGHWASFDASFSEIATTTPYVFYVVSPSTAFLWPSNSRDAVSVTVPGSQTPTAASPDELAQIIVAHSESYSELPSDVDVTFEHITAYGRLTLKNISPAEGVTVQAVNILSEDQPLAGDWYYSFSDGSISPKEASSSLIINTRNIDVAGQDPIWFACAPAGLGGKPLKITAILSNGRALVRTISLKNTVNFSSGSIYQFSVDMSSAEEVDNVVVIEKSEEVYRLVTSTGDLAVNDEVIFVNSTNPTYAMTGTGSTNGLQSVAKDATSGFTFGEDGYVRLQENSVVTPLTVSAKSGSTVSFRSGTNYLYMGSNNSSRYLQLYRNAISWTISITTVGVATLSYRSGNRTYYVRYGSNYFNVNSSNSTFAIYKKVTVSSTTTVDLSTAPVLGYDDYGAYLVGQNLVYNASTDQLSREYESNGTMTFTILAPAEDQCVEFIGIPADAILGDTFQLRMKFTDSIIVKVDETYPVTVVREEGSRLYLADNNGNGFIVKR